MRSKCVSPPCAKTTVKDKSDHMFEAKSLRGQWETEVTSMEKRMKVTTLRLARSGHVISNGSVSISQSVNGFAVASLP